MGTLAVLTPSYRLDFQHFVDLHASVLRHTADDVVHHVVVPNRDVALFAEIGSGRLKVHPVNTYVPRTFLSTYPVSIALRTLPRMSIPAAKVEAINLRRPWPPVRGWVLQQIIKLAVTSRIDADVVLIADSDITLIRPVHVDDFLRGESVRFYRKPGGITTEMTRHSAWHIVANRLLGIDAQPEDATTDYVSSFQAWDPKIVGKLQNRIRDTATDDWRSAIARELHFSEFILYGVYVDRMGTALERSFTSTETLCRSHWDPIPLDRAGADRFVESIGPDDVAIQIQSASHTPADVRRYILAAATERAAGT